MRESEITFVIQGPEYSDGGQNCTVGLAETLVEGFPQSTVIYASTESARGRYPSGCRVLPVADPGEFLIGAQVGRFTRNIKRQQATTLAGLRQAATPWAMKLRSDTRIDVARLKEKLLTLEQPASDPRVHLFYHSAPFKLFMLDDRVQLARTELLRAFWTFDPSAVMNGALTQQIRRPTFANRLFVLNGDDASDLASEQLLTLSPIAEERTPGGMLHRAERYLEHFAQRFIVHHTRDFGILSHKWAMPDHPGVRLYLRLLGASSNVRMRAMLWLSLSAGRASVTKLRAAIAAGAQPRG
jgi:hypothetical protein